MGFIYKAKVFTGDGIKDGTMNRIFIQLIGTMGFSDRIQLPSTAGSRGSVDSIDVCCENNLGQLFLLKLETECSLFPDCLWFCSKVDVTTPEGKQFVFPVYCWLTSYKHESFRDATAKLIFNDVIPEAIENRKKEVDARHDIYQWTEYADGLPNCMKSDNALSLPYEVRFSFTKTTELLWTITSTLEELQFEGMLSARKPWSTLEDLDQISCTKKTDIQNYVKTHWMDDEFFAYQFLNGLNPMMIRCCFKLPENFHVTEDMLQAAIRKPVSFAEEMQKGNIFLVDYNREDGLVPNVINDNQQYLTAPLVLLYLTPEDKLMPIAIQLKQKPDENNPIFLPTDSQYDWLTAKIFVRAADMVEHELNFHLLRTHLISEVFAVATLRNLPMVHPLYKLLNAHFRYTLQINALARQELLSKEGVFNKYTAVGGTAMLTFLQKAMASLTYSSLCMPEDITKRGLSKVPNFYYREDGLKLWDIINSYVRGVVEYYYTCNSDVVRDTELQSWINDIFVYGFLAVPETGIPRSFSSCTDLIKFLTMVTFTASVQHAAVNSGQYDFCGWMPNSPLSMQQPPPSTKGKCTKTTMMATLPDINVTAHVIAAVYLLSKPSTDYTPLGHDSEEQFVEETPLGKIKKFREDLKVFGHEIKARNVVLPLPYTYLDPDNVENSVAI